MARDDAEAPELAVAKVFQLAGYEVSQVAGAEPGTVDWFATPREGFVRHRTYWRVWRTCPDHLDAALAELEQARVARRADRALAVVMEGRLPEGHSTLAETLTNAVSHRRFVLEVSGISARVADHAAKYEARGEPGRYLSPHTSSSVSLEAQLKEWVASGETDLALWGTSISGHRAVIEHVAYEIARDFARDPEHVTPLVQIEGQLANMAEVPVAFAEGFAVPVLQRISDLRLCARGLLIDVELDGQMWEGPALQVMPASSGDMDRWYRQQILDPDTHARFARVRRDVAAFGSLSDAWPNAHRMLEAMTCLRVAPDMSDTGWLVRVVLAYVQRVLADLRARSQDGAAIGEMEEASLEELVLGGWTRDWPGWRAASVDVGLWDVVSTWVSVVDERRHATNRLVRDCLIAQRIARDFESDRRELLVRYDLPEEYVLLFLAVFSPEAAAQAAAGRSAEIRAQIESEVERRLQLTLAHMLKRSAGAVRSHVKSLRRHVEKMAEGELDPELARVFARVEEESAFQCALAEQTRRLYEVPESEIEGMALEAVAAAVAADLRESHPQIAFESAIDPSLRVRASKDILREVLHILLENAFQAVAFTEAIDAPRVRLEAQREGDTIRLDVLDNGPGVAPGDRERVFDLHVTTKKGGDGRPLGTGMGLPIARRYAEHVGAQLGLDPAREQTCFFVRFVGWREIG